MYNLIYHISMGLPVMLLFSIIYFYANKFLRNVKKNEKLAWTLIFVHPSASKSLKILTISVLSFSIVWIVRLFSDFFLIEIPLSGPIGTYICLIGYVYFFKTLAEITEEK